MEELLGDQCFYRKIAQSELLPEGKPIRSWIPNFAAIFGAAAYVCKVYFTSLLCMCVCAPIGVVVCVFLGGKIFVEN